MLVKPTLERDRSNQDIVFKDFTTLVFPLLSNVSSFLRAQKAIRAVRHSSKSYMVMEMFCGLDFDEMGRVEGIPSVKQKAQSQASSRRHQSILHLKVRIRAKLPRPFLH